MKIRNYEVFTLHAELCKVMSNPKRLMIIDMLSRRDMSVGEIADTLETQPATVSQHLRLLRDKNLVDTRKDGQTVYYSLALPRMMDACHLMREVLLENLKRTGALADDLDVTNLIEDLVPEKAGRQSGG